MVDRKKLIIDEEEESIYRSAESLSKNEKSLRENIKNSKTNYSKNEAIRQYYSFFWKVRDRLHKRITLMSPKDRRLFVQKYGKVYDFRPVLSLLEKKVLKNMKRHNQMTSKRYKSVLEYKRSQLGTQNHYPKWDLYDEIWNKKFSNVTHFTNWHVKKYYVLKKTISFFYGYLKHKNLKQAFLKTNRQKNRILSFLLYLESFLITVLFRMGFVLNFIQGKQFIRHGFILLNQKKIVYRFHKVKKNDVITYNYNKYNKFLNNNVEGGANLLKSFMNKKTLFPHLWVNRRALLGIVLYNPNIYYRLLLDQYPNLFFNSQTNRENENTEPYNKKNMNKKAAYNKFFFKESNLQEENRKGLDVDIFDRTFLSIGKILNKHKLPIQNIKLVLAYMVKQ